KTRRWTARPCAARPALPASIPPSSHPTAAAASRTDRSCKSRAAGGGRPESIRKVYHQAMKTRWLVVWPLGILLILATCLLASSPAPQTPQPVDFEKQVRPILETRCQPCHFPGGKMYARMPFDRPQTIRSLGTKMFTRIKDEREQAVLRAFLAQGPP